METDVEGAIGARRYERSGKRTTWGNGYRDRTLDTRLGALQLLIPKLRQGSYFPSSARSRCSICYAASSANGPMLAARAL